MMLLRRQLAVCPYCGQRMLVRHGVKLSPLLADLFDIVERAGEHGITMEVLCAVFYPGKPARDARNAIKSNVVHLNERLASTDIEIRAGTGGHAPPYRILPRREK